MVGMTKFVVDADTGRSVTIEHYEFAYHQPEEAVVQLVQESSNLSIFDDAEVEQASYGDGAAAKSSKTYTQEGVKE